jgi:hypothetical protein
LKSTRFHRRNLGLGILSLGIVGISTTTWGQQGNRIKSTQEEFAFFNWLYQQGGFDINNPNQREPFIRWLTDIDGECIFESSVYRCISPTITEEEYSQNPSGFYAVKLTAEGRNSTVFEPSWNEARYCVWDGIFTISISETNTEIVKVSISARR